MPEPRGETGSVRGVEPERAEQILTALVEGLWQARPEGRQYQRRQALYFLRKQFPDLDDNQVQGFVQVLDRLDGVSKTFTAGERLLPPEPAKFVANRHWKSDLRYRNNDLPARTLLEVIRAHDTPEGLARLRAELEAALRQYQDIGV